MNKKEQREEEKIKEAVRKAIKEAQEKGFPIARFDAKTKTPYFEYPDIKGE